MRVDKRHTSLGFALSVNFGATPSVRHIKVGTHSESPVRTHRAARQPAPFVTSPGSDVERGRFSLDALGDVNEGAASVRHGDQEWANKRGALS